jgi:hypothetical protein
MGLILEFEGIGREEYEAVNRKLGLDATKPSGDWPSGLLFHAGGAKSGGWVVFEVWDSRAAQGEFMEKRLVSALRDGGVTAPPVRIEWLELAAHTVPAR